MNAHRSGRSVTITTGSWVPVLDEVNDSEFLGFISGLAEVSVLLGYDAASIGNLFRTFLDTVVVFYSVVKMRTIHCPETGSDCLVTRRHIPEEQITELLKLVDSSFRKKGVSYIELSGN
jgi:hypothetical protein